MLQLIAAALLAGACVPAAASVAPVQHPAHFEVASVLVLRLDDVRGGAVVLDDRRLGEAELASMLGYASADDQRLANLGYTVGYGRLFAWGASTDTPQTLVSTALLFADPAGAHQMLLGFTAATTDSGFGGLSLGGPLGDEAAGFALDQDALGPAGEKATFTTTVVAFRHANAVTIIVYRGAPNEDDPLSVIAIARKQLDLERSVGPRGVPLPEPETMRAVTDKHMFPSSLVLHVGDLPAGMRVRSEGTMGAVDFASGDSDIGDMLKAAEFLDGYGRNFTRKLKFGKEPREVTSATAIFSDTAGTHDAFKVLVEAAAYVGARKLGDAGIGEESAVLRLDDYTGDTTYVVVYFRQRNAVSYVEMKFPAGFADPSTAVRLAETQVRYELADLGMLKPIH
jgi:hypothetical protein